MGGGDWVGRSDVEGELRLGKVNKAMINREILLDNLEDVEFPFLKIKLFCVCVCVMTNPFIG